MTNTHDTPQPNEIVDITLSGVRFDFLATNRGILHFQLPGAEPDGRLRYLGLAVDQEGMTITRSIPADGEPKPGEVWMDASGSAWLAHSVEMYDDPEEQVWLDNGRNAFEWRDVHRQFGPVRRVWAPDPEPDVYQVAEDAAKVLAAVESTEDGAE